MTDSPYIHQTSIIDPGAQIGPNTRIWHWVHVCSGAHIGNNCSLGQNVFVGNKDEYRPTLVRKGATLGANCTVICGTTIGAHAFIAAGAVVNKDVPAFALMVGVPARHIGWMSRHGEQIPLSLEGYGQYQCPRLWPGASPSP
jgi:UDP-2-acetamido-3-amino-2,3-dideoxy-glucuronate N-acetyltransferase